VGDRRQSAEGDICEVTKPGIERWTRHRFDRMQADGGRMARTIMAAAQATPEGSPDASSRLAGIVARTCPPSTTS